MELIEDIKDFLKKYKSKLIILLIAFILMIYSIISMDMYLIIATVEIFIIYVLELICESLKFPLLGEKKLLELFVSTSLLVIIFIVGYPLLDASVDNSVYKIFVLLYLNWYFFTNVLINFTLKDDLKHQQSLNA